MKKNILIINGGGGSEHAISLVSSQYLEKLLHQTGRYNVLEMTIEADGTRHNKQGDRLELRRAGELFSHKTQSTTEIDLFIPCIHGPPGETGDIQAIFELMKKPYLGPAPEASRLCFNKVSTKLWFDALGIKNTPWVFLNDCSKPSLEKAHDFFKQHKDVFIKAASQGSSIGCYHCTEEKTLERDLKEAFRFSPYVIIEKTMNARELEMSFFEYKGELMASSTGEILCPQKFYDYEEKYNPNSQTKTVVKAAVDEKTILKMQEIGKKAFQGLKLRHFSRIDFFLDQNQELFVNEINTFPGMTPISLFPQMIEAMGISFSDVLIDLIETTLNRKENSL